MFIYIVEANHAGKALQRMCYNCDFRQNAESVIKAYFRDLFLLTTDVKVLDISKVEIYGEIYDVNVSIEEIRNL